jgi:hypothetical protein
MSQTPAHERASELFSHAAAQDHLHVIEILAKTTAFLEHPMVSSSKWNHYSISQALRLGQEIKKGKSSEISPQKCYLTNLL